MSEYVYLVGAEDVARAGSSMQSAAEDMQRAASVMEESLRLHQQFLDDWLSRFEFIMKGKDNDEPTEAG